MHAQREIEEAAEKEHRQQLKDQRLAAHTRPMAPYTPGKRPFRAEPPVKTADGKWCRNWANTGVCTFGTNCKWASTHTTQNAPKAINRG